MQIPFRSRSRSLWLLTPAATVCLTVACGGGGGGLATPTPATPTPTPAATQDVQVTLAQRYQRISGFGASSAWHSTPPSNAQADLLFSAGSGAGLSLERIRIAPDGTTWETSTALMAQQRGARVWAAPWSPPGAWKTNGSDINGGRLKPEYYQAWADRLADFARSMPQAGIQLAYLSAQNEPGWVANWETCEWTPAELLTFIRDYLGPALTSRGVTVPILAPESNDWIVLRSYADPLLNDPIAASYLGVIAVHAYGGTPFLYSTPAEKGKEFWESEWSARTVGAGMASGLEVAQSIHDHLTVGNVNAWHYWWLTDTDASTAGALIQAGVVTKRLWVMGNFSRFLRPGAVRVAAVLQNAAATPNTSASAFRDDSTGSLIVVAINRGSVAQSIRFVLADGRVDSITPWVTSESQDLVRQSAVAGGSSFTYDLAAQSVTTFVGAVR
jgi:glucuronoarabinoxylan endo-1,4-beta-xylanase